MKKIFNPFAPTPVSMRSHVRGWALHWAECLDASIAAKDEDLANDDELYFDHGVNFGGGLNLFGGVTEDIVDRIEQLIEHKAQLVSLDRDMPDYAAQLHKRLGQSTCHERLTAAMIDQFGVRLSEANCLRQQDLNRPLVAIGDSHATAFAAKGSSVLRTNGQTLYGALKGDLISKQIDALGSHLERVTLVYGSIDIRHHIGRQERPEQSLRELCNGYAKTVRAIKGEHLVDVEVAAPVPVEHEGRKLPQTGYYQGTPFYGSRDDRLSWTRLFIEMMQDHNVAVVSPPATWYAMDGELYAKTHMEMGGSVHIAPTFYRRFNWGQQ